eukprot:Opistho-2@94035
MHNTVTWNTSLMTTLGLLYHIRGMALSLGMTRGDQLVLPPVIASASISVSASSHLGLPSSASTDKCSTWVANATGEGRRQASTQHEYPLDNEQLQQQPHDRQQHQQQQVQQQVQQQSVQQQQVQQQRQQPRYPRRRRDHEQGDPDPAAFESTGARQYSPESPATTRRQGQSGGRQWGLSPRGQRYPDGNSYGRSYNPVYGSPNYGGASGRVYSDNGRGYATPASPLMDVAREPRAYDERPRRQHSGW